MENFEIFAIRTRCSKFQQSRLDHELNPKKIVHGLLKIEELIYYLLDLTEKTHKYFHK